MSRVAVTLGLGSNLGDKAGVIRTAAARLGSEGLVDDLVLSSLYRTAPWGIADQDWFVNACAAGTTSKPPRSLLAAVKALETDLGRTVTRRWGPRVIDIDILTYGDQTVSEGDLVLPHKGILDRAFVLVPLVEIRPDLRVRGIPIVDRLAALGASDIAKLETGSPP